MLAPGLVVGVTLAYLLTLFAVAYVGDKRAEAGRSVIASPWVYALSMAVYCTAWTISWQAVTGKARCWRA